MRFRQLSDLLARLSSEQGARRRAHLHAYLRARIHESLAAGLAGRRSPVETEDFLAWLIEAYRQQRAWLEPPSRYAADR